MPIKENRTGYLAVNWQAVFKGILAALVITFLGCIILGLSYHFTMLSEKTLPVTASVLFYTSIFLGSILAAWGAGHKGLLHGITVTIIFIILSMIIAKLFLQMGTSFPIIAQKGLIAVLAGAVGGIIGVSLSR